MSETALAILENSQRHTGAVLGLISNQMQANAQLNLQKEEFTANLAMKQAEFAQQSRYNDAKLQEANFRNQILAEKWQVEKEMMPLKLQEAQLNLQAAKSAQENATRANKENAFGSMVTPFRAMASANFSGNRDPEYGQAYLALESKYKDAVINKGAPWVQEQFEADFADLNSKFKDKPMGTTETYDPEVASLFSALGDSKARAYYEGKTNPTFTGSMPSLISGMLTSDDESFQKQMGQHSSILGDEKSVAINLGRDAIKYEQEEVERLGSLASKLDVAIAATDPEDASYDSLVQTRNEARMGMGEAFQRRKKIIDDLANGRTEEPETKVEEESFLNQFLKAFKKEKDAKGASAAVSTDPFNVANDSKSSGFKGGLAELESNLKTKYKRSNEDGTEETVEVNPLGGLSGSLIRDPKGSGFLKEPIFYNQEDATKKRDITSIIKRTVANNVDGLTNYELVSLIQSPIIEELVSKADRDVVGSSKKTKTFSVGKRSLMQRFEDSSIRKQGGERYAIESMDDVLEMISMVESSDQSENAKRKNLIDIYSSILSVAVDDKIQ